MKQKKYILKENSQKVFHFENGNGKTLYDLKSFIKM
jgi:hypothetical protein